MNTRYPLLGQEETAGESPISRSKSPHFQPHFSSHFTTATNLENRKNGIRRYAFSRLSRIIVLFSLTTIISMCIFVATFRTSYSMKTTMTLTYGTTPSVGIPKEVFMQTVLDSNINGPYDPEPLRKLCETRTWTPGLILSCDGIRGGIGNVMDIALNCVRYAIEAGAEFVIPEIQVRDENLIDIETENTRPLSYMFDTDVLVARLAESCPEMKVHHNATDIPNLPDPFRIEPLEVTDYDIVMDRLMASPDWWNPSFTNWLGANLPDGVTEVTPEQPVYVILHTPLLMWPTSHNGIAFRRMFGRILSFASDMRRVAAAALYHLSETHGLALNPGHGIEREKYVGVHLRTAADATAEGWAGYDFQSLRYLELAKGMGLKLMYVASGSPDDTERLRIAAREQGITVVTKRDLLWGDDLGALNAMTWDQQGIVDFLMLLRSSYFSGIDTSSFAWLLAVTRGLASVRTLDEAISGTEGQAWVDEFSWIWGEVEQWPFFPRGLWP